MPLTGLEPAIPASERPQTDALNRAGVGFGTTYNLVSYISS